MDVSQERCCLSADKVFVCMVVQETLKAGLKTNNKGTLEVAVGSSSLQEWLQGESTKGILLEKTQSVG